MPNFPERGDLVGHHSGYTLGVLVGTAIDWYL